MNVDSSKDLPFDVQRRVDEIARDFEKDWQHDETPALEAFIEKIETAGRVQLLRELLLIELHYRRNSRGEKLASAELCQIHSELMPELAVHLESLSVQDTNVTQVHLKSNSGVASEHWLEPTQAHEPRTGSSRGLHIRCPHCSNPVELLADTSFDSITCLTCGSAFSLVNEDEATQSAPILKTIGRFEIIGRLGVGGFGTVWKARDSELERAIAIKIPRKGQLDAKEIESFFKEAKTTAQLHHPNIVPVYEIGKDGDTIFIVSELVRGVSLSDWLTGKTPTYREIAQLLAKVARALDHAHQKGVIHRDLKPSNILMDDSDQPLVMDFGLAKRDGVEIAMTVDGQILGTPAYMSPEQAAGNSNWTDRRMDIYSFGVVLFRALTGELPYRGNAQMQIHQRLTQDAPDPRTLNRFVPRDLSTICLKCLERDPNGRYSTAQQLADELDRFLSGEPIQARPISSVERTLRWAKRKPALATALGLTVVLAIGGPVTAIMIETLRQRQIDLVQEKDNLIRSSEQEARHAIDKVATLQSQIDLWEGRANPFEFWPPDGDTPPKRIQLSSLLSARESELLRSRDDEAPLDEALRQLTLATLYEATDRFEEAKQRRFDASRILENVDNPTVSVQLAMADNYERLAALEKQGDTSDGSSEDPPTQNWYEMALKIRRELAAKHRDDALLQALQLHAELQSSVAGGFENATEHLQNARQIEIGLRHVWPTSPAELYRLVCQLAGQPALLADEPHNMPDE